MDRARNRFAPGAGHQPPELAGRDQIIEDSRVALERVIRGRPDRGHLLLGLRGVGKTVLLNRIEASAEELGYYTLPIEAREDRSLVELLAPKLRGILTKLSRHERAKDLAQRGLGAHRSAEIAGELGITVPMFDDYMRRAMPEWAPPPPRSHGRRRKE